MTANRIVSAYSYALAIGGLPLLIAVLLADPRWTTQAPEIAALLAATLLLRIGQIPLSKYSYLTQTGLPALGGSLLIGLPATALALALGVLASDWLWQRKLLRS